MENKSNPQVITEDEWFRKFKPIKNTVGGVGPNTCAYEGHMFETYGAEYEFVRSVDPKLVWTWIDSDGDDDDDSPIIVPGLRFVNRIGYFVASLPRSKKFTDVIVLSDNNGSQDD